MECLRIRIVGSWFNMRLGGANQGMWRIPDGNVRERSIFMFGAPRCKPLPVSVKDRSSGPSEQV
jgi:hypothetical protein